MKYGPEAVDTLNNNFFVDDMLKSVAIVPEAITLVKNVRGMRRDAGDRLTKFLSNSKELIMLIPQTDRRKEAPHKTELETIPNNESALGLLWNTEDDKLEFPVHKKGKPLSRQEILSSLSSIYDPL